MGQKRRNKNDVWVVSGSAARYITSMACFSKLGFNELHAGVIHCCNGFWDGIKLARLYKYEEAMLVTALKIDL